MADIRRTLDFNITVFIDGEKKLNKQKRSIPNSYTDLWFKKQVLWTEVLKSAYGKHGKCKLTKVNYYYRIRKGGAKWEKSVMWRQIWRRGTESLSKELVHFKVWMESIKTQKGKKSPAREKSRAEWFSANQGDPKTPTPKKKKKRRKLGSRASRESVEDVPEEIEEVSVHRRGKKMSEVEMLRKENRLLRARIAEYQHSLRYMYELQFIIPKGVKVTVEEIVRKIERMNPRKKKKERKRPPSDGKRRVERAVPKIEKKEEMEQVEKEEEKEEEDLNEEEVGEEDEKEEEEEVEEATTTEEVNEEEEAPEDVEEAPEEVSEEEEGGEDEEVSEEEGESEEDDGAEEEEGEGEKENDVEEEVSEEEDVLEEEGEISEEEDDGEG